MKEEKEACERAEAFYLHTMKQKKEFVGISVPIIISRVFPSNWHTNEDYALKLRLLSLATNSNKSLLELDEIIEIEEGVKGK